jgi:hypothetical protein
MASCTDGVRRLATPYIDMCTSNDVNTGASIKVNRYMSFCILYVPHITYSLKKGSL